MIRKGSEVAKGETGSLGTLSGPKDGAPEVPDSASEYCNRARRCYRRFLRFRQFIWIFNVERWLPNWLWGLGRCRSAR